MAALNEPVTITRAQLQYLAQLILEAANSQTEGRMVTVVNSSSDDKHIPTAKAVNTKIGSFQNFILLTIASGDPSEANITPDTKTLYMVRTSATSEQVVPYIWTNEKGFITTPGAIADEPAELAALTDAEIAAAVESAAENTVAI